ncbi:MAG TPA: SUMF1/EgtB/PvdO family nonheme iron enzyme [Candidatus Eisenbacteria bacterium]|jgi:ergothioneine biosynthesis protein EgtB|nr:SUMF1/EgtB/PvdO family nonheme iron enzyme [Candidatus Eisenbacteria bacterium]
MATTTRDRSEPTTLALELADARSRTDDLFSILRAGALFERPIPERHRLIFYLGHLEAFDWNLIARQGHGLPAFREDFDKLFAFGIDPVDGGLPNEPASAWPAEALVRAYNRDVRDKVDACVLGGQEPRSEQDRRTLVSMAIEHRLMHAETLAYLLHQLPYGLKEPRHDAPAAPVARGARGIAIPEGMATLGQARGAFGWDNEFDEHGVHVPEFRIEEHKVTNGRFLDFVKDGGYGARALWSDEDWAWKERHGIRHPGFWSMRDGAVSYRGMFAELPLPLEAPVYVSHAEASAFARWSKAALPTEAEFHRAAYGSLDGTERPYPWGEDEPGERHGNFDLRRFDPTPVGFYPDGASAFGVQEMVGNGWEWTRTPFAPFAGFHPHPFYAGYSKDFFDGKHFVLKGASPRSASCFLRRSFRNWFQPRYPYVYATVRLVRA